ncbi:MAG TPA: hypothetical protein DEG88_01990 [Propionibacteriaceae bacterium]|nr:hypothetical protein [Propionibacteriaceae bacterium]HBY22099.1 hypothetical protein [Propionibacteriaceae bacterium]
MAGDSVRPRAGRGLAFVVLSVLGLVAAFWAGRVTLQPSPLAEEMLPEKVLATVTEQTVGRQLSLNVTVTQPRRPLAVNELTGVVTEVGKTTSVGNGDVVYRVANVPVRAIEGRVPFYRGLHSGSVGQDVRQLERALVGLGLMDSADSTFTERTAGAVKAWQTKLGTYQTGTVAVGELVAVPTLPGPLALEEKLLFVGGRLSGGEQVVFGAAGDAVFALVLSEVQARLVPTGASVSMTFHGKQWQAIVTDSETDENGQTSLTLTAPGGGPVCGADCGLVGTGSTVSIPSKVTVVEPATGPAVPVAAIQTFADGKAKVIVVSDSGDLSDRPVEVLGSQDGTAVVQGVVVGERVQALAGHGPAQAQPSASPSPSR